MNGAINGGVRRFLRSVVSSDGDCSDAQLLGSYVAVADGDAFAALVRRHGPMVFGVCRRVLGGREDAEDAFQVAFLVLARKAASVRPGDRLAGWLYGVAYRAALKAREASVRRRRRERPLAGVPEPATAPEDAARHELGRLLDRELSALPEKYRLPVVICDLEGKTGREAAGLLGWPEGTVTGRLTRARKMLADRLTRRGAGPSGGLPAAVLPPEVPTTLLERALRSAGPPAGGAGADKITLLTEEVIRSMLMSKCKTVALAVLAAGVVLAGAGVLTHAALVPRSPAAPSAAQEPAEPRQRAEKAPAEAEKKPEQPNVVEEKVRAERLQRALDLRNQAEREYLMVVGAGEAEGRLRVVEAEERLRAVERRHAAERGREEARLLAAEAALDKVGGKLESARAWVAELEAQVRKREPARAEEMIEARRALVKVEEALHHNEREGAMRTSRALSRLERAEEEVLRADGFVGDPRRSSDGATELAAKVEALTREVTELRRAVERLRRERE